MLKLFESIRTVVKLYFYENIDMLHAQDIRNMNTVLQQGPQFSLCNLRL